MTFRLPHLIAALLLHVVLLALLVGGVQCSAKGDEDGQGGESAHHATSAVIS
jgi:hypothetical protein